MSKFRKRGIFCAWMALGGACVDDTTSQPGERELPDASENSDTGVDDGESDAAGTDTENTGATGAEELPEPEEPEELPIPDETPELPVPDEPLPQPEQQESELLGAASGSPGSVRMGGSSFARPGGYVTIHTNFPGHYYFAPEPVFSVILNQCPAAPWRQGWWYGSAWAFRYWFAVWCGENFELFAPKSATNLTPPARKDWQTQVWREQNVQRNEYSVSTQIYIEECPNAPWRRRPWGVNSGYGHDYWFDQWCGPGWVGTFRRPNDGTSVQPIAGGRKQIIAANIAVKAVNSVPDAALRQARGVMYSMFGANEAPLWNFGARGITGVILGRYQFQTTPPEYAALTPASFWDCRARGVGATPSIPVFSAAEENLLLYGGDGPLGPCNNRFGAGSDGYLGEEDIFLHEFAHASLTYAPLGVPGISLTLRSRAQTRFNQVCPCGNGQQGCCAWPYTNTYAGDNVDEYWAEGVQSFFNANDEGDATHGFVNTRAELYTHDRPLHDMVAEVYQGQTWYPDDPGCKAGFCVWCRAPFCFE